MFTLWPKFRKGNGLFVETAVACLARDWACFQQVRPRLGTGHMLEFEVRHAVFGYGSIATSSKGCDHKLGPQQCALKCVCSQPSAPQTVSSCANKPSQHLHPTDPCSKMSNRVDAASPSLHGLWLFRGLYSRLIPSHVRHDPNKPIQK